MFIGEVAHDGLNQIFNGDKATDTSIFVASFEQSLHGLGRVLFLFGVLGLGQRGNREEELEKHCDGKDEVEKHLNQQADAGDPDAPGAGKKNLGQQSVEDEYQKDQFAGGTDDLRGAGGAGEGGKEGGVGVEAQAEEERNSRQGELTKDGGGEGNRLATKVEARLND